MGELERMGREILLEKAWLARKEVLAVRRLMLPNIPVNALTPQQFGVYASYQWMACDEYEKVHKDMTLRYDAFIAQEVARRADTERAQAKKAAPSRHPAHSRKTGVF